MTMRLFALLVFLAIASICISGQTTTGWERVTSEKGDVTFLFPMNPVVIKDGSFVSLDGGNGTTTIRIYKNSFPDPRSTVRDIAFKGSNPVHTDEVTRGKFLVKRFDYSGEAGYSVNLYAGSDKDYYSISVKAKDSSDSAMAYFLDSISFAGEALNSLSKREVTSEKPSVALERLKTSDAVTEAETKRHCPHEIKYANAPPGEKFSDNNLYSRRLILIRTPQAQPREFVAYQGSRGTVVLRLLFKADGCIGPSFVISETTHRPDTWDALRAAMKIRFLPAEIDGRPVDSYKTLEYKF